MIQLQRRTRHLLAFTGLLYLTRLVGACLVASPIAATLRATGVGQQPNGDAVLFAPGGWYLFETLRLAGPALSGVCAASAALLVIAVLLQVVPQGALVHGLVQPRATLGSTLQLSLASFPRFLLLGGLGFLAQAAALVLGLIAGQALRHAVGGAGRAISGEIAFTVVLACSLLLVCVIGALVDLARLAHGRGEHSISASTHAALRTLRQRPLAVAVAALVPVLGVFGLAVGVGFVVGGLHVELGSTWRWVSILTLHQLVIVAACAAEARWQSRADYFVQETLR
jgi:hypothetical protein